MESVRREVIIRCLSGERECTIVEEKRIYPERCDGRLSSSSARHRRRVIHPPDPPRAVDVAPEPPSASSSSSHASSSSAAAQAPDGPVALLPSVVIRELGVDHRLETARRERRGQGEGPRICRCARLKKTGLGALVHGEARCQIGGLSGHSQRDDEVHDAPEHVREYARTPYRAPVDHRACRIGFRRASVRG